MHRNLKPLWILFLAVALGLAGCSGRTAGDQPQENPDVVVQRFYTWYLDNTQSAPKDARQSGVLTEGLAARIEAARASGGAGNMVNFVCAQDFPESVSVGEALVEGDQASVPVETSWGSRLQIRLVEVEGAWLIDDVQCIR